MTDSRKRDETSLMDDVQRWLDAPAPGAERADALPVPLLPGARQTPAGRPRRRGPWGNAWRYAGAAAIFLIGFAAGRIGDGKGPDSLRRPDTAEAVPAGTVAPGQASPRAIPAAATTAAAPPPSTHPPSVPAGKLAPASAPPVTAPVPPPSPDPAPGKTAPGPVRRVEVAVVPDAPDAASPPARRVTEKDGRLLVETTLQGSGARATWIVDGSLQIAQASQAIPGDTQ